MLVNSISLFLVNLVLLFLPEIEILNNSSDWDRNINNFASLGVSNHDLSAELKEGFVKFIADRVIKKIFCDRSSCVLAYIWKVQNIECHCYN